MERITLVNIRKSLDTLLPMTEQSVKTVHIQFLRLLLPGVDSNTDINEYWNDNDAIYEISKSMDQRRHIYEKCERILHDLLSFRFLYQYHDILNVTRTSYNYKLPAAQSVLSISDPIIRRVIHETYGMNMKLKAVAKICVDRLSAFFSVSIDSITNSYRNDEYEIYDFDSRNYGDILPPTLSTIVMKLIPYVFKRETIDYIDTVKSLAETNTVITIHHEYLNELFNTDEFSPCESGPVDVVYKMEHILLTRNHERFTEMINSNDWHAELMYRDPLLIDMYIPEDWMPEVIASRYVDKLIDREYINNVEYEMKHR